MELLIGSGSNRGKRIFPENKTEWESLITLDMNKDHRPDFVHDLMDLPLPFDDNTFDEIHAYEVLEHTGQQGDYRFFFKQWEEFWRILKPGGYFAGTSPDRSSPWAWGDPGHTRIISPECLTFLSQAEYTKQVGKTPMSDYRFLYRADFEGVFASVQNETFIYVLKAVK